MRITGLAAGVALAFAPGLAARQPDADAGRALAAWAGRQATPAARYEFRTELFPANLRPGAPKPGDDGAFTGTALVILDPAGGRVRADQDERQHIANRPERLSRIRQSVRYDGREQTSFVTVDAAANAPAEPAGTRVFAGPWGGSMRWPVEFAPLAWGHGLAVPDGGTQVGPFPAAWRPTADRFQAVGREDVNDRACAVLRDMTAPTDVTETLWVDVADGAVVRARSVRPGATYETSVTYRDTPHGRLPAGWEVRTTPPGRPAAVQRKYTVTAVRFDPPTADDFRVELKPGMILEQDGRTWTVSPDGALEPVPPEAGSERPSALGRAAALLGPVGIIGLAAATGLTGGLVVVRRRRKRAA